MQCNPFTRNKPQLFAEAIAGFVEEAIAPNQPGRIKCDGTFWPAKFYQTDSQITILPGTRVAVIGIEGITLLVTGD